MPGGLNVRLCVSGQPGFVLFRLLEAGSANQLLRINYPMLQRMGWERVKLGAASTFTLTKSTQRKQANTVPAFLHIKTGRQRTTEDGFAVRRGLSNL